MALPLKWRNSYPGGKCWLQERKWSRGLDVGLSQSDHMIGNRGRSRGFRLDWNRTLHPIHFFFKSDIYNFKTNGKNVCAQGTGRVLVNIMTSHRCQCFSTCQRDLCLHITAQVVHSFVMMELHSKQSSTKEPTMLAEGYLMCFLNMHTCWMFSAAAKKKRKKKKPWFLSV